MSLSDFYVKLLSNQTFILFTYGEMEKEEKKSEWIFDFIRYVWLITYILLAVNQTYKIPF